MKIIHVSDGYLPRRGGIECHVRDLAERQSADGHDVVVVTTTPGTADPRAPYRVIRPTWDPRAMPTEGMQHTWVTRALAGARFATADIAHVHTSTVSPLAFGAARLAPRSGAATVVTMHSMVARARLLLRTLDGLLGWRRSPAVWTAVSSAAAHELAGALGQGRTVWVLPNAVDAAAWTAEPRVRDPRRLVVASSGRLAPRKRPLALLGMLREARARIDPDVEFAAVLAGDGPERPALERYLSRHGMGDWVALAGVRTRPQLRELYRGADVYVAPATLESFGLAALEARCAGLPVVAHAGSGVADFVAHRKDGLLVASDTAMTDALVALAHDPASHARLLHNAGAAAPALSWDQVLPLTYEVYDRAAALRRPAGRAVAGS